MHTREIQTKRERETALEEQRKAAKGKECTNQRAETTLAQNTVVRA